MVEVVKEHRVHGGVLAYCRHDSAATGTPMQFTLFRPPGEGPFASVVWLSGLTCTEDNFTTKAGAYGVAADLGLVIIAPDTSPRGEGVADAEGWDIGQSAGFYVDATQAPWAANYRMETYVTRDLLEAASEVCALDPARRGVSGHSMGGHGALTLALRHPELFRSVSAFAPIASPMRCPWGEKAFGAYLGPDEAVWAQHDAARLIEAGAAKGRFKNILVDQGAADSFLEGQLKPELLEAACKAAGQPLTLRMQEGYDHSYFFISTFIGEHLAWHAEQL